MSESVSPQPLSDEETAQFIRLLKSHYDGDTQWHLTTANVREILAVISSLTARIRELTAYVPGVLQPDGVPVVVCKHCREWDTDKHHIKHKADCALKEE